MHDPEKNYPYKILRTIVISPTKARHELSIDTAQGPYRVDVECEDEGVMNTLQTTANEVVKNLGAPA